MTFKHRWIAVSILLHAFLLFGITAVCTTQSKEPVVIVDFTIEKPRDVSEQKPLLPVAHTRPPCQKPLPVAASRENFPDTAQTIAIDTMPASELVAISPQLPNITDTLENSKASYITQNFRYIRDLVYSKLKYPPVALENNWQGEVLLSFCIHCDGRVDNIQVTKSSGYALLDKNAIDAINNAGPYPKSFRKIEIHLPISYRVD